MSSSKKVLNDIILKAKIGDDSSIGDIKNMYSFVFEQVTDVFIKTYDFLVYQKGLLAKEFYECLVECVSSYKFQEDIAFGTMLKTRFILRVQKILVILYSLTNEKIIKQKTVYHYAKRSKVFDKELRRNCLLCLRNLDRNMKFPFFLRMYKEMKYLDIVPVLKDKESSVEFVKTLYDKMYQDIIDLFSECDPGGHMAITRKIDIIHRLTDVKKNNWMFYMYHKY